MIPGDDEVKVTVDGAIMQITIDRPKANAIDLPTSRKLGEAFVYFRDTPELKVAIITGAGEKIFCAGWDLKALDSGDTPLANWWEAEDADLGGFAGITEMWNLNKPVIAALNGLPIVDRVRLLPPGRFVRLSLRRWQPCGGLRARSLPAGAWR